MAADPLVIVKDISNFSLDPNNPTRIVFLVSYDISFVPNENSPQLARQDEISIATSNFSKTTVRQETTNRIIAEVGLLGGIITGSRIFTVGDLI